MFLFQNERRVGRSLWQFFVLKIQKVSVSILFRCGKGDKKTSTEWNIFVSDRLRSEPG